MYTRARLKKEKHTHRERKGCAHVPFPISNASFLAVPETTVPTTHSNAASDDGEKVRSKRMTFPTLILVFQPAILAIAYMSGTRKEEKKGKHIRSKEFCAKYSSYGASSIRPMRLLARRSNHVHPRCFHFCVQRRAKSCLLRDDVVILTSHLVCRNFLADHHVANRVA